MLKKLSRSLILFSLVASAPALAHEGEDHEGTIEVDLADDFVNMTTETIYYMKDDATGARKRLHFTDRDPGAKPGSRIKVKVRKAEGDSYYAAAGDATITPQSISTGTSAPTGSRKVINLKVNFPSGSVSCTEATQAALLFDQANTKSVANYFEDTSNGKLSFYGDVATVTLSTDYGSSCDYSTWASAADAAAKSQLGLDVTTYQHRVYTLPSTVPCNWSGLGSMPGYRTWIKSCSSTTTYAHELGHNLGMHHAASATAEYGDYSDVMGAALREVNAPHREQMAWTPASKIVTSTTDGTYRLAPLARDPSTVSDPQILKIPTSSFTYYFSYRKAEGVFDSSLSTTYAGYMNVHKFSGGSTKTMFVAAIAPGASFVDSANGIEVSNNASMTDYLEARVRRGTTPTTTPSPTPTPTPSPTPTPPPTPSAPTSLTVSASTVYPNGRLLLKWIDNSGIETSYEVQRSTDGVSYSSVASLAANSTAYTDTNLVQATKYYYRVRAKTSLASSSFSNVASRATTAETSVPAAPTSLTATRSTVYPKSRILLAWTDNSSMEDGYEIWRSTDGVNFTRVMLTAPGSKSATIDGLASLTTYYFKVRGYNSLGTGSFSNKASARTN